jgi:uncharacterized protein (TIGR03437 family)
MTMYVSKVINAFGLSQTISPNTWVAIQGINLAPFGDARTWLSSDFVSNQMPTVLDGASVTMNSENAYVEYISGTQLNVLTPPDLRSGAIQIKVTNGPLSAVFTIEAQQYSPSFFVYDDMTKYVIAVHLDSSRIGPLSLFPGLTTPSKPGEEVVMFANGFGPSSTPAVSGSVVQSGSLPTLPVIRIGGVIATVRAANLISPGLYQFNVVVPPSSRDGDNLITATYKGLTTPVALLTVQH